LLHTSGEPQSEIHRLTPLIPLIHKRADVLMIAEGLHVCETEVPPALAGKTLAAAAIPRETGCSVVALRTADRLRINPAADETMRAGEHLILICTPEAEQRFLEKYRTRLSPARRA